MPRNDAEILIVGAGLAGAATAYHLRRRGRAGIVLLEQEEAPGMHSSGRNAAIIRAHADDPLQQPLLSAGAQVLRTGRLAQFERNGIMLLGLGHEDVRQHFPRACGTGRWCPDDGVVDVGGLLQAYLAGQDVRCGTRVIGWSDEGDGLRVHTDRGTLTCGRLVNAAGPWAGTLGGLPLTPMNRHLFSTGPLPWVDAHWPTVWDGRRGLYFRPESGGLLLSCCDETAAEPGAYDEDPALIDELAAKVASLQPDLGALPMQRCWVGQRTFAPDRQFVIGQDPRTPRLFHVAGLGGHGVTASYAVGELAARLLDEDEDPQSAPFSPRRLRRLP